MSYNKFSAVKTVVDGITFASKREGQRYAELRILQRAGQISELKVQPKFPLTCGGKPVLIRSEGYPNGRASYYLADFEYLEKGERVVEDVKGMDNPLSRLKRAIVEAEHGVRIQIVR